MMEPVQQEPVQQEGSALVEAGKGAQDGQQYTVYVGNLAPEAQEEQLAALFAPLGPTTNVKVMRDKATGTSAGFGFVTFLDKAVAEQALEALNGQVAWGRPLKLQWAQQRGSVHAVTGGEAPSFDVFVGDLARDIDEQKLRDAFSHLGTVTRVVVMWDYPTGRNKGYGFVSFGSQQEAELAIQTMHGAVVGSRPVRCGWGQRRAQQPGGLHAAGGGGMQHPFGGHGSGQHGGGGRGMVPTHHQQAGPAQWGGPPRGGPQSYQLPQSFAQLQGMMMSMQLGMDPQQAQQLAAQQGGMPFTPTARPMGSDGMLSGHISSPPMANGGLGGHRPGAPRGGWGKASKGGGGGGKAGQPRPPEGGPPKAATASGAADLEHPVAGSTVSLPALAEGGAAGGSGGSGTCCVRVDNVDKTVQKAELFGAFAKFGTLEDCNIVRKGNPYHAIIRFATPQQAADAAASMNGFSLDGRRLRCAVEGTSPHNEGASALPRPKSTSDLPLPPRGQEHRSQAVSALAAKMRAVLQDRGELPSPSPKSRAPGMAEAAAAAAAAVGGPSFGPPEAGSGAGFGGVGGGHMSHRAPPPPQVGFGQPQPHAGVASAYGMGGGRMPQHAAPYGGAQQAQQAPSSHQWMSPSSLPGDASPMAATNGSGGRGGGGAGGGGGGGPQHAKHPPPGWGQQPQGMLSPQLLMAQQAAAAQHVQQTRAGAGGGPMMPGMAPMGFGPGGVVLPPQLAMLNMMAQGVPGAPPAFTLPMMYGGQPMVNPQVMQPAGFAALQQQALIQQLLMHQQAQHAAQQQQAAAGQQGQAGSLGTLPPAEHDAAAPAGAVDVSSLGSAAESIPSTGGTPPPTASTPPPLPQLPAEAVQPNNA